MPNGTMSKEGIRGGMVLTVDGARLEQEYSRIYTHPSKLKAQLADLQKGEAN